MNAHDLYKRAKNVPALMSVLPAEKVPVLKHLAKIFKWRTQSFPRPKTRRVPCLFLIFQ